jgi:hypothetical protein
MWRDDGDWHHENAAGAVLQGLGDGTAEKDRGRKGVHHLAVGRAAHGAAAGGPL